MKKFLFFILAFCASQLCRAQYIPYTEIPYNVNYHWGLIDVMIAQGTVKIECNDNQFYGTLDGTSIPWEGKIICVSDTLSARMVNNGDQLREIVDYQNGWYRRPSVEQFRSSGYNAADPAIYKNIHGQGSYDASNDSMEAITVTADMIGMYYYSRIINFNALRPGESFEVQIDGQFSNKLVVTYQGEGTYEVNGTSYPTYDCSFEYSYGAGMSGYPVECKIGVDNRLPLFLSASLPVGRVEMLYAP